MLDTLYMMATPWATASRMQRVKNRILGRVANYAYPIYCAIAPKKPSTPEQKIRSEEVIVSLTSFPGRIDKVYLCVNTLLRQTVKPDRIILWLATSQFPSMESVPTKLLEQQERGLEIKFCDDLRSYKKFFYTAKDYSNSVIVTVDDDTLYPESWLQKLLETHKQYPNCVTCYRAHKITFRHGKISPYNEWVSLSPGEKGPSQSLIPIGVGGVLYPVGFFDGIDLDFSVIKELCPTTDDLWLKIAGICRGYKTVKVNENSKEWFTICSSQKSKLTTVNVDGNENDRSMERLMRYYNVTSEKLRGG